MRLPILVIHVSAGILAMLAGALSIILRKGSRSHRMAGNVYVISMLTVSAGGAYLAFRGSEADNVLGGMNAFYLVATAWATARRGRTETWALEWSEPPIALVLSAIWITWAVEYVDGVPIHTFCKQEHLSVSKRLELSIHVCETVQFAHQNLIVHRDLKPDNIFVAEDGTPRLLDFGTANLLAQSPSNSGRDLTRGGFQSFTPQYASPEQVLGNPITTASDTYSLGVLLYLLLTGMLPYELKELTTAEMLRVIREQPPRKLDHAEDSDCRLDPDLEAILLKALRKEPAERYRTAEQLAGDLRAYLDGKPVAARRGTVRYRAAKFVRRHRIALAAAALVAAILAAGIATLREMAAKDQAAPEILNQAADAFLNAEPASLRNPSFALACAERAVALNHRQRPSELLILAQAYRAAGQIDRSRAAAEEGLALLPPLELGSVKPNIRKLLEIQARPAR
jgi:hypothetical protein